MNAIPLPTSPQPTPTTEPRASACVIVNPRSHTVARDGLAAPALALARAQGADVIEAHGPETIAAGLDRALAHGARRIIVLAGDGTVHAIVDRLAMLPPGAPMPPLLLLGGGRSNLTAADLGGSDAALKRLETALLRARSEADDTGAIRYRHALVVEQPPAPLRHGFFVAGALVDRLIRRIHRYRHGGGRLRKSDAGTAWCVLRAVVPVMRGNGDFASPTLDVDLPGQGSLHGPVRIVVATTLAHADPSFNPYADRGEGALRATAVADGAAGFWRRLPRLLRGRFSSQMTSAAGYLSGRCPSVSIRGLDGYTLDGQSFDCDPSRPVVIRTGPRIAFLAP